MKPYPAYKDSGIEWIGEVPEHWEAIRGDHLFENTRNSISKEDLNEKTVFHYSIPVVQETGNGTFEDGSTIDSNKYILEGGELLYSKLNPRKETICISEKSNNLIVCSTEFVVLEPQNIDLNFAYFLFKAHPTRERICSTVQSATKSHQRANPSEIYKLWHIIPKDPSEQTAIANFLDHKTAQIDAAIEKHRRLIELLQEHRAAIINEAVTKGINPNAPMKDSGIEWIGEIPGHWEQNTKLLYIAKDEKHSFVNGPFGSDLLTSEISKDGDVPVIYIRDIKHGFYKRERKAFVSFEKADQLAFCQVDPNDLLIAKVGDPPGTAAIYPSSEPQGIVTQDVVRIRTKQNLVSSEYLVYLFNSDYGRSMIKTVTVESTRSRFSLGDFKNLRIILPPLEEQKEIAKYIETETTRIDEEITLAQQEIDLLEEYRQALIAEAVTGKIDVRDYPLED